MKTEQELAQEALDAQDVCNLSAVVHTWSKAMTNLWAVAHAKKKGTDWVNTHPVAQVWADKAYDLAFDGAVVRGEGFDKCTDLAEGKEE